jgi:hypothetical protein
VVFFNEFSTCTNYKLGKDKVIECPFGGQFKKEVVYWCTACQTGFMPKTIARAAEVLCEAVRKDIMMLPSLFGNEGFDGLTE